MAKYDLSLNDIDLPLLHREGPANIRIIDNQLLYLYTGYYHEKVSSPYRAYNLLLELCNKIELEGFIPKKLLLIIKKQEPISDISYYLHSIHFKAKEKTHFKHAFFGKLYSMEINTGFYLDLELNVIDDETKPIRFKLNASKFSKEKNLPKEITFSTKEAFLMLAIVCTNYYFEFEEGIINDYLSNKEKSIYYEEYHQFIKDNFKQINNLKIFCYVFLKYLEEEMNVGKLSPIKLLQYGGFYLFITLQKNDDIADFIHSLEELVKQPEKLSLKQKVIYQTFFETIYNIPGNYSGPSFLHLVDYDAFIGERL